MLPALNNTGRDRSRLAHEKRHGHGILEHVQRKRPVALTPEPMMAATEAVVAGKYDQGIVSQAERFKSIEEANDIGIHRRNCREISLQHLPIPQTVLAESMPLSPCMYWLLRTGVESTVCIGVNDILRVSRPRRMGRRVVHTQIERRRLIRRGTCVLSEEIQRIRTGTRSA